MRLLKAWPADLEALHEFLMEHENEWFKKCDETGANSWHMVDQVWLAILRNQEQKQPA